MFGCADCMFFKKEEGVCIKSQSHIRKNPEKYGCSDFKEIKKISIIPRELKEGYTHCETCNGTGWLVEEGYLKRCRCVSGLVQFCDICGKPYKAGVYNCSMKSCKKILEDKKIQKKLSGITVLDVDDEKVENCGMFFSECYNYNDGYVDTIEDFIEHLENMKSEDLIVDLDKPSMFLYLCDPIKFELDIDSALERETEDHFEDAYDHLKDVEELRRFVDEWNKKQSVTTYYCNEKYRVDLSKILYKS